VPSQHFHTPIPCRSRGTILPGQNQQQPRGLPQYFPSSSVQYSPIRHAKHTGHCIVTSGSGRDLACTIITQPDHAPLMCSHLVGPGNDLGVPIRHQSLMVCHNPRHLARQPDDSESCGADRTGNRYHWGEPRLQCRQPQHENHAYVSDRGLCDDGNSQILPEQELHTVASVFWHADGRITGQNYWENIEATLLAVLVLFRDSSSRSARNRGVEMLAGHIWSSTYR